MEIEEQKKEQQKVPLPKNIINYYSKYKNHNKDYTIQKVCGTFFELGNQYEIIDSMGQGAYGTVIAVIDKSNSNQNENLLAIKKIEKTFDHKIYAKRTLRELKILRLLKHENTILLPKSREEFEDIYIVYELMETDLSNIIKSPQSLFEEHCQFFLYQILRGIKYIHSAGILHRDLKPKNLLVNSNCDLKICDFGLSRAVKNQKAKTTQMTEYVATRWYRAPELLLGQTNYTAAVDV